MEGIGEAIAVMLEWACCWSESCGPPRCDRSLGCAKFLTTATCTLQQHHSIPSRLTFHELTTVWSFNLRPKCYQYTITAYNPG
jgi:hypothetical protein